MKLEEIIGKEFIYYTYEYENTCMFFFVEKDSVDERQLTEANHRGVPLGGPYSAIHHKAHIPDGLDHLHVYYKNSQIFALNFDGTAHDRSHQMQIPIRVADGIREKFPTVIIPPSNFIESVSENVAEKCKLVLHG